MKDIRLVIISGPSGTGKSTAIKALEDLGFFCVDNMPSALLPKFMELLSQSREISKVAAVVDVREGEFLKGFIPAFNDLKGAGYGVEIIFLEASDDALVRRFSETRRRHPLAASESPLEGIQRERDLLKDLKSNADKVIDTTGFNVHQLRDIIKEHFSGTAGREKMTVTFISFGYRFGVPADADLVLDVRFLPNPYFVEKLKWLDGTDEKIREFVLSNSRTVEFIGKARDFLSYLIPLYWKEGKSYLTVAVGCTGGRHRSVVIIDELAGLLGSDMIDSRKRHRDIQKI